MIANEDLYWYRASYLKNHDGDTVSIVIDLGYGMAFQRDIRMYGINTPEMYGATMPQGKISQQFLQKLLKASEGSKLLRMKSFKDKDDKYGGRVLGELWLPLKFSDEKDLKTAFVDPKGVYTNLNQLMIKVGLATAYFGVGEKV